MRGVTGADPGPIPRKAKERVKSPALSLYHFSSFCLSFNRFLSTKLIKQLHPEKVGVYTETSEKNVEILPARDPKQQGEDEDGPDDVVSEELANLVRGDVLEDVPHALDHVLRVLLTNALQKPDHRKSRQFRAKKIEVDFGSPNNQTYPPSKLPSFEVAFTSVTVTHLKNVPAMNCL